LDLFLHNYIADMPGPTFLAYYFVFLIVSVVLRSVAISFLRLLTPTGGVPEDLDSYQFAFLRAGDTELLATVQFSLFQRGYLAEGHEALICAPGHPDVRHLTPVELSVFEGYQAGFDTANPTKYVERHGRQYEAELQEHGLLVGPSGLDSVRFIHYGILALYGGLGAYKLTVAMMKGYSNVLFLVLLTIIGVIILATLRTSRVTLKGEKYLNELRKALEEYRSQLAQRSTNLTQEERALAEPKATLLMGVFGAGVLMATAYGDIFESAVPAPVASSSSSGSSFFSFSSCSSSSCSSCSSCGGCGGGGCGGCGG
jgi:uncharacterized protein (TIGR04222 family)